MSKIPAGHLSKGLRQIWDLGWMVHLTTVELLKTSILRQKQTEKCPSRQTKTDPDTSSQVEIRPAKSETF